MFSSSVNQGYFGFGTQPQESKVGSLQKDSLDQQSKVFEFTGTAGSKCAVSAEEMATLFTVRRFPTVFSYSSEHNGPQYFVWPLMLPVNVATSIKCKVYTTA